MCVECSAYKVSFVENKNYKNELALCYFYSLIQSRVAHRRSVISQICNSKGLTATILSLCLTPGSDKNEKSVPSKKP